MEVLVQILCTLGEEEKLRKCKSKQKIQGVEVGKKSDMHGFK